MINNKLSDDEEINKRMRGTYATGNMLIRKFGKCNVACKILMFKTFFSNIYACGLWARYRVASYGKMKVSHNDIFRSLLNVRRDESASTLFVQHNVNNLDSVIRCCYFSLMTRVRSSANPIISALVRSKPWKLPWHSGWPCRILSARCMIIQAWQNSGGQMYNALSRFRQHMNKHQSRSLIHEYFHTILIIFIFKCIFLFHIVFIS